MLSVNPGAVVLPLTDNPVGSHRVGVCRAPSFYQGLLRYTAPTAHPEIYRSIPGTSISNTICLCYRGKHSIFTRSCFVLNSRCLSTPPSTCMDIRCARLSLGRIRCTHGLQASFVSSFLFLGEPCRYPLPCAWQPSHD